MWHLGRFGGRENTPIGRGGDSPTILSIPKNAPTSRSVNIFPASGLGPTQYILINMYFDQPKLRPVRQEAVF